MKFSTPWLAINKGFCRSVFISSWERLKIPHPCKAFESCWNPDCSPRSLLLPPLQRWMQQAAREDAQHTELWPQPELCFSSHSYMRKMWVKIGKKKKSSFLLTFRDKPDITDECCSQPGMKRIWWEQLSSLIFWALMLSKQLQLTSFVSQACALTTRQSHDSFHSFPVAWWIFNSFIKIGAASARRLVTASHFGD